MTSRTRLQRKEVDDVLGGDAMWKDVDQTDVACPKCDNGRAYFMQLQIRSADEPMTTFYKWVDAPIPNAATNGEWTSTPPFGLKNFLHVQRIRRR
ncbi:RNA polymerase III C11 subunit [Ceratobasidium sp. 370]|nr:RNA polymerase III C11 subunit [Ceratobasidium sp. 370]